MDKGGWERRGKKQVQSACCCQKSSRNVWSSLIKTKNIKFGTQEASRVKAEQSKRKEPTQHISLSIDSNVESIRIFSNQEINQSQPKSDRHKNGYMNLHVVKLQNYTYTFINVIFLVLVLYYHYVRCSHLGQLHGDL